MINNKKLVKKILISLTLLLLSAFFYYSAFLKIKVNPIYSDSELLIDFIDVGQGDCILIQNKDKNILIDSGPSKSKSNVLHYLKEKKVVKIDYLFSTHPHEDHIGNMSSIIDTFDIDKIYAPKVTSSADFFKSMIESLNSKKLKINAASSVDIIKLSDNFTISILSPILSSYENLNNYSTVLKIQFGSNTFLFMGDAEEEVEGQLITKNEGLKADLIKLGHHGSNSSSSSEFLNKVDPDYAVISCGKNNNYGHPHKEVLNYLNVNSIKLYRTDLDHNISIISNGQSIVIN